MIISGNIISIRERRIFPGQVTINNGLIQEITETNSANDTFILPGFVDAHVHIESSLLVPSEFARLAVVHGTVATVSDPHEIANVVGVKGVEYMIANGKQVPFKFNFGAPSCVPATSFETAGAIITVEDIEKLMQSNDIKYLAEMMNWPGVLFGDPAVLQKIAIAKRYGKPVDGHAPGLRGEQALKYIQAGMSTDHECFTAEEALDKLRHGMKVLIREGSAAKNFEVLAPLLHEHWANMMFCSDDKHPDSLELGHINVLVRRALVQGIDLFKALQAACINPVEHYHLDVGTLRVGEPADFVVMNDLKSFEVMQTFINGQAVAKNGRSLISSVKTSIINNFKTTYKEPNDFAVPAYGTKIRVIEAIDGQLITNEKIETARIKDGSVVSDITRDILKLTVVNRYADTKPAMGFIRNFMLKSGAMASSVAHDSHNIIAVGVDDDSICRAVNLVIGEKGGLAAVSGDHVMILPLPVGGIMSSEDGYKVSQLYQAVDRLAKNMGCTLSAPFMTLSFMALLVIPQLKLSDQGLFDGNGFTFTSLFVD